MEDIKTKIKKLATKYHTEIIDIRRQIHANPELSEQEFKTADFIASKLDEYGIPYEKGIAETGVVGLIKGTRQKEKGKIEKAKGESQKEEDKKEKTKTIALRADMDALPIIEENTHDYKSKNHGVMHACGHDAHMASLLGAAKILNEIKNDFSGNIKLIFQPSEESYPGGAIRMIKQGVMKNPKVDSIFAQHVEPEIEVGKVGMKSDMYMASTDEVYLTVKGKGGHAALPDKLVDPIVIAANIIISLQQIVSRNASPLVPTVLSFGKIIGQGRTNVIPDIVTIDGTIRTFNEPWRKEIHKKIKTIAQSIAKSLGGSCDVRIAHGYPFLVNEKETTEKARKNAIEYLGKNNVLDIDLRMTAEDFAYFAENAPACFYRLGTGNKSKGISSNLHTSTFEIDEKSLEIGMGLMAWIGVCELR